MSNEDFNVLKIIFWGFYRWVFSHRRQFHFLKICFLLQTYFLSFLLSLSKKKFPSLSNLSGISMRQIIRLLLSTNLFLFLCSYFCSVIYKFVSISVSVFCFLLSTMCPSISSQVWSSISFQKWVGWGRGSNRTLSKFCL